MILIVLVLFGCPTPSRFVGEASRAVYRALTDFVQKLRRTHPDWEFPDFDPLDGGCNADILFLFENQGR